VYHSVNTHQIRVEQKFSNKFKEKICVIWLYLMLLPLYKILIKFTFVLRFKLDFLNLERKIAQYSLKLNRGISLRESIVYFCVCGGMFIHFLLVIRFLYMYIIFACKHLEQFYMFNVS